MKWDIDLDKNEEHYLIKCPKCSNVREVPAYMPVAMWALSCFTCNFKDAEDDRHI